MFDSRMENFLPDNIFYVQKVRIRKKIQQYLLQFYSLWFSSQECQLCPFLFVDYLARCT